MKMAKRMMALFLTGMMIFTLAACGQSTKQETEAAETEAVQTEAAETAADTAEVQADTEADGTQIQVFIAASLSKVMEDVAAQFNETHPDVEIVFNADSSGTLMEQIQNGYACDVFFSAAQKQMNTLEEGGFLVEGTRADVLNNQLIVIARADTETAVTGLENLGDAESLALADGSVPVGKYTRQALMNLGILPETDDPSAYTTQEVSEALGGVEISEQGNVSKVLLAVVEGSCEVGTTYYSDTYGYEDQLQVLETVGYDVSGNIIYPVAQIVNEEADEAETAAAKEFVDFITSDEAKTIFDSYYFDTNL